MTCDCVDVALSELHQHLAQTLVCVFPYGTEVPQSGHLDCALWAHVVHLYCRRWFLQMAKNMVLSLWNLDNLIDEYYFFILD